MRVSGKPLPVYGDGKNVRDWLYVEDHCRAIRTVLARGRVGETYNIGGRNEKEESGNCEDDLRDCSTNCGPNDPVVPHRQLITFVKDRPGHDRRYAMDTRKIERELGWRPQETFESGMRKTVDWYLGTRRLGARRDQRRAIGSGWRSNYLPDRATWSRN